MKEKSKKLITVSRNLDKSIFLDSGAHSLYIEHVVKKKDTKYTYFHSDEFWEYVDSYCKFIKNADGEIDVYANVDVIRNPELSYKVYRYIVDVHKLSPLPVIHFGTDLSWLKKYMEETDYIGIGGLGQNTSVNEYYPFGDKIFKFICDKEGYPTCKLHGFAITSPKLLFRYPWYSVDSTSWVQYGRFGAICVPKMKNGKFDYRETPIVLFLSVRSPSKEIRGKHIENLSGIERSHINNLITKNGFKLGSSSVKIEPLSYKLKENEFCFNKTNKTMHVEIVHEKGLCNDGMKRDFWNALYFENLSDSIPKWPWKFKYSNKFI